jgi:hypothetical protein
MDQLWSPVYLKALEIVGNDLVEDERVMEDFKALVGEQLQSIALELLSQNEIQVEVITELGRQQQQQLTWTVLNDWCNAFHRYEEANYPLGQCLVLWRTLVSTLPTTERMKTKIHMIMNEWTERFEGVGPAPIDVYRRTLDPVPDWFQAIWLLVGTCDDFIRFEIAVFTHMVVHSSCLSSMAHVPSLYYHLIEHLRDHLGFIGRVEQLLALEHVSMMHHPMLSVIVSVRFPQSDLMIWTGHVITYTKDWLIQHPQPPPANHPEQTRQIVDDMESMVQEGLSFLSDRDMMMGDDMVMTPMMTPVPSMLTVAYT